MNDVLQRIQAIEKEIRETPYHKGTEHHIGRLRARLAKLKDSLLEVKPKKGGGKVFAVKKQGRRPIGPLARQGDATVVLVGPPSVGKSTLLNKLTHAKSRVAAYAFTTVTVIPGMMKYKGASIQILDVPGLIEGAAQGRGRGREVLSVVRGADLLLLMAEVGPPRLSPRFGEAGGEAGQEDEFGRMQNELYLNGVRLNENPPKVEIQKTLRGGLNINSTAKQDFAKETVKEVAREFGLTNAEIKIREKLTLERLIDAFARNRVWVPALFVVNKVDQRPIDLNKVTYLSEDGVLAISAEKGTGIEKLKEAIWKKLGLVRVYLRKGNATDYETPQIMHDGQALLDVAQKIGEEFAKNIKEAKIWGPGARFPGQKVSLAHKIEDEMEVTYL